MEVMAEANEQPALLNQRLDEGKKSRRPRNAAGARKPSAAKSGTRRTRRPSKEPLRSAEHINSSGQDVSSEEEQHVSSREEQQEPNSQISLPISAPAENVAELVVPADQSDASDSNEIVEQPAVPEAAPPKLQEPAPAVETPKYEPVFGEGLIEVSGKGFGFLRDPKRNYTQSPQDIFVTPEVVRKHALRDGLWIKGEIRRVDFD
jgi:transcription termination factor Rho